MAQPFEYGVTPLVDGIYLVRVTWPDNDAPELRVAEWSDPVWMQIGIDYDIWQFGAVGSMPTIEVICGLDLERIAAGAEAQL